MNSLLLQYSPFVKQQFESFGELQDIILAGDLDLTTDWKQFKTVSKHLDSFQQLRKYRKSRLALIAASDVKSSKTNPVNHLQTLKKTSDLADLMIIAGFETVSKEFDEKYGQIINSQGQQQSLIIFALGKLGGRELNFSSDIDLIFCFSGQGYSNGPKSVEAEKYFNRFGRRLIQLLDSQTIDGRVYRVDMRLRPFGSAAPLACSVDHLLNYLQTEGRDWERYAWLRARGVAGNIELLNQTLEMIQPFIYRKYLDYGVFESLRQIKQQILRNQQSDLDNIKLGQGGIREIEFIIQTLQLTFAGRDKNLRGADLWKIMQKLNQKGHLTNEDLSQLQGSWLFLRRLENYCQIREDQDTHHLPKNTSLLAKIMGHSNEESLIQKWSETKTQVHQIFTKIFLDQLPTSQQQTPQEIQTLKDLITNRKLPKQSKHKVYQALDAYTDQSHNITEENRKRVLENYFQVILATARRTTYLSMLVESPVILNKLISQLQASDYFATVICQTPQLLEILFENRDESDFDFANQWKSFSDKHQYNDDEELLELLCQFKNHMQFLIISDYTTNSEHLKCCLRLTQLAELILKQVVDYIFEKLVTKNKFNFNRNQLLIVSYGSMATSSMHLSSDFDLVFLWDSEQSTTNMDGQQRFVMKWVKKIVHFLSTPSYSGWLYSLDTQLRPNGNSGTLVVSQKKFAEYQAQHAWVWELAALIKSRVIYGTNQQVSWFEWLKKQIICQNRDSQAVDQELSEMSLKLAKSGAKPHQKEFFILGQILKFANKNPLLCDWQNAAYQLKSNGLISAKEYMDFSDANNKTLRAKLIKSIESNK